MSTLDLQFEDLGSVCVMQPLTPKAKNWIQKHVAFEFWQVVASCAITVDHCVAGDLKRHATAFGLTIRE
jgi:hypothetical protein